MAATSPSATGSGNSSALQARPGNRRELGRQVLSQILVARQPVAEPGHPGAPEVVAPPDVDVDVEQALGQQLLDFRQQQPVDVAHRVIGTIYRRRNAMCGAATALRLGLRRRADGMRWCRGRLPGGCSMMIRPILVRRRRA